MAAAVEAKIKTPARPADYTSEDIFRHCTTQQGRIILAPAQGYARMSGIGMVFPLNPDKDLKGTYHNLRYGRVLDSGQYSLRDGKPVDMPGFPLPAGTYVEHTMQLPLKTVEGYEVIASTDMVRVWPHAMPPPWWPEEGELA